MIMSFSHKYWNCHQFGSPGEKLDNGLQKFHSYTITGARQLIVDGEPISLLRIRNPWGTKEWKGAWNDESDEWKSLSEETKREVNLTVKDDGEFWMCWDDFVSNFTRVNICMLHPCATGGAEGKEWATTRTHGRWQKNVTSGGCLNFPDTFYMNPQVRNTLYHNE